MLRNVVGRPVQGEDFFGRGPELSRGWRTLQADNLLLLAPRRVGKTSFMYRLRDGAAGHGFSPVFVDAGRASDEHRFLELLCQEVVRTDPSLLERLRSGPLGDLFAAIRPSAAAVGGLKLEFPPGAAAGPERWLEVGDALLQALDRRSPTLILIDEMPALLLRLLDDDIGRARAFLAWFRSVRQHQDHTRWVIAGSIGLDTIAERHALSDTINDLVPFQLGAFDADDAAAFLEALGASYGVPMGPDVRHHLVERLGWPIPFFLQLVARELFEGARTDGEVPDVGRVDAAFASLLDASKRSLFVHWRTRLEEQLGPVRGAWARALLDRCADPAGASVAELGWALEGLVPSDDRGREVAFLLRVLDHDGYVVRAGDRVLFRSPLVRGWWVRTVPDA